MSCFEVVINFGCNFFGGISGFEVLIFREKKKWKMVMVKELGNRGITLGLLGISPGKVFLYIRELACRKVTFLKAHCLFSILAYVKTIN